MLDNTLSTRTVAFQGIGLFDSLEMAEGLVDGTFLVLSQTGIVTWCGPAFAHVFGLPPVALIGSKLERFGQSIPVEGGSILRGDATTVRPELYLLDPPPLSPRLIKVRSRPIFEPASGAFQGELLHARHSDTVDIQSALDMITQAIATDICLFGVTDEQGQLLYANRRLQAMLATHPDLLSPPLSSGEAGLLTSEITLVRRSVDRSGLATANPPRVVLHLGLDSSAMSALDRGTVPHARLAQKELERFYLLHAVLGRFGAELGGVETEPPPSALDPLSALVPLLETSAISDLSARQRDVLRQLAEGKPNKEIARNLDISVTTVKSHVRAICDRLGVSNRVRAATLAAKIMRPQG